MSVTHQTEAAPAPPRDSIKPLTAETHTVARNNNLDSLARLGFRTLALCLAAMALMLTAFALYRISEAFVDGIRAHQGVEAWMTASLAVANDDPQGADQAAATAAAPQSAHAVVAVITILMVGTVVLAIGLIRATFTLAVNSDSPTNAPDSSSRSSSALPGTELLRATTDAIATVLKGLPRR